METKSSVLFNMLFLVVIFYLISLSQLFSQSINEEQSSFRFEWGNSIWGNTISVGYDYSLSKHFYSGLSIGTGYFQYEFPNGEKSSLFVSNPPGTNNIFSLDFKQIIDLRLGYIRKQQDGFLFLNKYELGISYLHFLFEDEFREYTNFRYLLWKGSRNFSLYAVLLSANIISYTPKNNNHISFDAGAKLRFSTTDKIALLYESQNLTQIISISCSNCTALYWPFPELYLRIHYRL